MENQRVRAMSPDTRIEVARIDERISALRELLNEREKQVNTAFASSEKALTVAHAAQQKVNESQNEFRQALRDQNAFFVTRQELEGLDKRIQLLERGGSLGTGRDFGRDKVVDFILRVLPIAISLFVLWQLNKPK